MQTLFSPRSVLPDNANINVAKLGERFVAMTETPLPVQFDPHTLETAGVRPFAAPGQLTTAHPHLDRASGGMLNYAAKLGPRSSYRFFALAPLQGTEQQSTLRMIASLPVKQPAYMHSFGLTQRWLVLAEFPFVVNPLALALSGRPYIENYRWKPELGTRFTLVDRITGTSLGGFQTDPCFAFHHVNAYDDGDEVVVDLCAFDDAGVIEDLYLSDCAPASRSPRLSSRAFACAHPIAPSSANGSPTATSSFPASTTRAATSAHTGMCGACATGRQAGSRGSSRSTPSSTPRCPGHSRAAMPASRCSWRARAPRTRTTVCCCR